MENFSTFNMFSELEQAYAISQLDPFHDTPYKLEGAPSSQNSYSVVLQQNIERTLSAADFGLSTAAGNKWDCHITSLPLLQQGSFYGVVQDQPGSFSAGGSSNESDYFQLFPITAAGISTGSLTYSQNTGSPDNLGLASTLPLFQSSSSSAVVSSRQVRCIGQSFEVVDETPSLYQQGSVTVYERPSCHTNVNARLVATQSGGSSNAYRIMPIDQIACPPNNIEQATIIPNSRTWKSKDGVYVVSKRNNVESEFTRGGINSIALMNPPNPETPTVHNSYFAREIFNATYSPSTSSFVDSVNAVTPFNISGAYFTGLSSQYGTLRLRAKLIYEVIPDPTDTTLVVLATPTLHNNPTFDQLLDEVVQKMPPGVPQTWNPKGEHWRKVLETVGRVTEWLAPAASVLAPELGAIFGATSQVSKALAKNKAFGPKRAPQTPQAQNKKAKAKVKAAAKAAARAQAKSVPKGYSP